MSDTPSTTTRSQALNAASGAASKRLKERYPEDWNALMIEESRARGQEWQPKPSPEQRAAQEFERLLAAYPHLAEQVAGSGSNATGD